MNSSFQAWFKIYKLNQSRRKDEKLVGLDKVYAPSLDDIKEEENKNDDEDWFKKKTLKRKSQVKSY